MDGNAFTLRPARLEDALCLGVLATQVFLDTYATGGIRPALAREVLGEYAVDAFEGHLRDPGLRLQVAEVAGHLVAFSQVALPCQHALAPPGPAAELARLYVQEPFTRRGIGAALLHQAERDAAAGGAQVLWLTPWVHNVRALAFYVAQGYSDHGRTEFRFEGEVHENRLFARRLGGQVLRPEG
jgi:ribosomal protein S18 acetylase RimI-like enzyme